MIEGVKVEINNQLVDPMNLGAPTIDPCAPTAPPPPVEPEPEPQPEPENLEPFQGSFMIMRVNTPQVDGRDILCYEGDSTTFPFKVRYMSNHPLKSLKIYIDGVLAHEEQRAFNEMIFDNIYQVPINGIYDGRRVDISYEFESYYGQGHSLSGTLTQKVIINKYGAGTSNGSCAIGENDLETQQNPYNPDPAYDNFTQQSEFHFATIESLNDESLAVVHSEEMTLSALSSDDIMFNAAGAAALYNFDIIIPYWKLLELGCSPVKSYKAVVKGKDSKKEIRSTMYFKMGDCVGDSNDDTTIHWVPEEVSCKVCECDDLVIKGAFSSANAFESIKLKINGIEIDPANLGEPVNNTCPQAAAVQSLTEGPDMPPALEETFNALSDVINTREVDWRIPYWKLVAIGCVPTNRYGIEIIAKDTERTMRTRYRFTFSDCDGATDDPDDCFECSNGDCEESVNIDIDVDRFTNRPCECEEVLIEGKIESVGSPINEVKLFINGVEVDPANLGMEPMTKCNPLYDGETPLDPPPTDPPIDEPGLPPQPEDPPVDEPEPPTPPVTPPPTGARLSLISPSGQTLCDNSNTWSTGINIGNGKEMKKMYLAWFRNGTEIVTSEIGGVEGGYSGSVPAGAITLPQRGYHLNGTIDYVPMYFDANDVVKNA